MAWLVIKGISAFTFKLEMGIQYQLTFGHAQLAFPFLSSILLQPVLLLLGHLPCSYLNSLKESFGCLWGCQMKTCLKGCRLAPPAERRGDTGLWARPCIPRASQCFWALCQGPVWNQDCVLSMVQKKKINSFRQSHSALAIERLSGLNHVCNPTILYL